MICPICKQPHMELKHSVKCGCGHRLKQKKDTHTTKHSITLKASS